jgi:hypothetical protein
MESSRTIFGSILTAEFKQITPVQNEEMGIQKNEMGWGSEAHGEGEGGV